MKYTIPVLAIVMGLLAIGCSGMEWGEVADQAGREAPGALTRGVQGGPAGMIYESIALAGGLVAGWYGRKYGVKHANVPPLVGSKPEVK